MASCATAQACSSSAVLQPKQAVRDSSQNYASSLSQIPLLPSSHPHKTPKKRTSHIISAARTPRRRQRRTTTEVGPDPKNDDTPDKWKKEDYSDGRVRPWLDQPGIWEGERLDALGTFVQWMPLIGGIFAALGGGYAVVSYNGGATDIKETEEFQAAIQAQKEADDLAGLSLDAPSVSDD